MSNHCKEEAGKIMPVVDYNRCEAKGPCIEVCPYDVFEMQKISDEQFSKLSFIVINPQACHSCGLCVTACPEKAIKLTNN